MRFTIERLRTLVLVAAVLLVAALGIFLGTAKWRNPFSRKDLPRRLSAGIQQETNGWTYTHEHNGHTVYKIHASKLEQLTAGKGGRVLLHGVKIELYGEDGSRLDRIEGNEFEYDQKNGTASAPGMVDIVITRPETPLAIVPNASNPVLRDKQKGTALAAATQAAATGAIHVRTSGLVFDQKSGIASTGQRVEFSLAQGQGSAEGASYDSDQGRLVLEHAVELKTRRGNEEIEVRSQRAEFERDDRVCSLHAVVMDLRDGEATAADAKILFRDDGSAVRLDVTNGLTLTASNGGHLSARSGTLEFDEHNHPQRGSLREGVTFDSIAGSSAKFSRQIRGTSPTADLLFTPDGKLRRAHLERGVDMRSEESSPQRHSIHTWRSPIAEIEFREAAGGAIQPAAIHGSGGVQVTGENRQGAQPGTPSRFTADELTGQFGAASALTAMVGTGHAALEQISPSGARQRTSGDRIEAHFSAAGGEEQGGNRSADHGPNRGPDHGADLDRLDSATVDGHVVLVQNPPEKPVNSPGKPGVAAAPLKAYAKRAVYEGAGEWLHLTGNPRIEDGDLQLAADRIDFSQATGDAFAHGHVKATWTDTRTAGQLNGPSLGGSSPVHAVAAEAQLHRGTGAEDDRAIFHGKARLWQDANAIEAPEIVLDRGQATLTATTTRASDPVRAFFMSGTAAATPGKPEPGKPESGKAGPGKPELVRVRGGELNYSDTKRMAWVRSGAAGQVMSETATATSVSNELEIVLSQPGEGSGTRSGQSQVERITARGRVTISSQGRRGTGERLDYSGRTGEYVLTGTASAPPRVVDPVHGTVTGESLIFRGGDSSVTVEGGARRARTETTAPR